MKYYTFEYANVLVLLGASVVLGAILMAMSFFLSKERTLDFEKLSAYECGFDPFGDCRSEFNVHFYLIGILFIIFDLEVVLLFPWAITVSSLGDFAIWSVLDFLIELTLGFAFIWLVGALEL